MWQTPIFCQLVPRFRMYTHPLPWTVTGHFGGSDATPADDDVSGASERVHGPVVAAVLFEAELPRCIWHRYISKADSPPAD